AAVLAGFFGTDRISFTSASENAAASERTFTTFSQAAAEAGISRIYGGIHWDFDNTAGLASGKLVGQYVLSHVLRPDAQVHLDTDAPPANSIPSSSIFNVQKRISGRGFFDNQEKTNPLR
ncbi:MAG TPA: hypothetical protein VGP94_04765, partial [Tepidisphaeraceae bacterium]|nr:hypothetical protein [Tepidisphaeraceae bacterium]